MAAYPTSIESFIALSGTAKLSSPDHTAEHTLERGNITAIETVLGPTAGTSLLKNVLAGQFVSTSDGWNNANETWTYASASTITVPSGAASKYAIGDRIRWKQGAGYKYGVITAVADTLLTILVNTDFTVATPTAITDNYYSHEASPIGYPQWFACAAPTFDTSAIDNGSGGQPTTSEFRANITGRTYKAHLRGNGTKAGTSTFFNFVAPFAPANSTDRSTVGVGYVHDSSNNNTPAVIMQVSGSFYFANSSSMADNLVLTNFSCALSYEI